MTIEERADKIADHASGFDCFYDVKKEAIQMITEAVAEAVADELERQKKHEQEIKDYLNNTTADY